MKREHSKPHRYGCFAGIVDTLPPWELQGVTSRLEAEIFRLDSTFRSVELEAGDLYAPQPMGLPKAHWWYHMSGVQLRRIC